MYTLLLIGCILALTLCPLLLDAILTWQDMRRQRSFAPGREATGLAFASQRSH